MSRRDLQAEIRGARLPAPETLRARVQALPEPDPSPSPTPAAARRPLFRRRALVLSLPAAAIVAGAAVAVVLATRSSPAPAPSAAAAAQAPQAVSPELKRSAPAAPMTTRTPTTTQAVDPAEKVGEIVVPYGGSVVYAVRTGNRLGIFVDLPAAQKARVTKLLRKVGTVSVSASGKEIVELLVVVKKKG